jgi:hypothetical protein
MSAYPYKYMTNSILGLYIFLLYFIIIFRYYTSTLDFISNQNKRLINYIKFNNNYSFEETSVMKDF